jgi:predicted nucleotidyltransferase
MVKLPQDFKDFLKLLNSKGVKYLVIGGYAVGYHGYPRATADIDVWIARTQDNAQKVTSALREFGFSQASEKQFLEPKRIIRMGRPPFRIEVLTDASGVEFETCFASKIVDEIDGVSVNIIALDDLRANKKATGRHKDLADLENLP